MHIGIIPDGNRRYSKKNNITLEESYQIGFNTLKDIVDKYYDDSPDELKNIDELTFYVCSEDNLTKRSNNEVELICKMIEKFVDYYESGDKVNKKICINIVGNMNILPIKIRDKLLDISSKTINNNYILNLAIAYDGKKDTIHRIKKGTLYNSPRSDIDIVIRTGYEKRTSGFFPLHTIYSEWFFLDKYFPELTLTDFEKIINTKRNRRFGE